MILLFYLIKHFQSELPITYKLVGSLTQISLWSVSLCLNSLRPRETSCVKDLETIVLPEVESEVKDFYLMEIRKEKTDWSSSRRFVVSSI